MIGFTGSFLHEQLYLELRFCVYCFTQFAFFIQQRRIDAIANPGSCFVEQFQKRSCASLFTNCKRFFIESRIRTLFVHLHQNVDVKLVRAANSCEIAGAQFMTQNITALRFNKRERRFDFATRIPEIAGAAVQVGQVVVNHSSRDRIG